MVEDIIEKYVKEHSGPIKTAALNALGLSNSCIRNLVRNGVLVRVRHGYFELSTSDFNEAGIIRCVLPEAILCMESALFYYKYSDFTPRAWCVSVPRTISRSRLHIDGIDIKPYFTTAHLLGKTEMCIQGVSFPIFDRERVICDCIRKKGSMDSELFQKALRGYASDSKKDLTKLSEYARYFRILERTMDYMGILLNG